MSAGQRLSRPAKAAFAGALAIYLTVAAWLVWRTSILEPYSDMYDWLVRWRVWQVDGDLGRYLWAPHNFHHLVWTFAVLGLDIGAFGASGYLFLAVGVLCLAGTAAMLARLAAQAAEQGLRLVGAGVALALSLMGCDILDATADINTTYVHALVFAVAAILLAQALGGRPTLRRGGALACAVAAGLGSAAGLAVWPALLFAGLRRGERRWAAVVLAAGAALSALYLVGDTSPTAGAATHGGVIEAAELFLNYLALPWVRAAPAAGLPIGVAVLAVSVAAIVAKARRGRCRPGARGHRADRFFPGDGGHGGRGADRSHGAQPGAHALRGVPDPAARRSLGPGAALSAARLGGPARPLERGPGRRRGADGRPPGGDGGLRDPHR